jgi:hypothetical protein
MATPEDLEAIPSFLRLTADQRREAWRDTPPRPMPRFKDPPKDEDPATRALRKEMELAEREKTRARLEKLKELKASKPRLPKRKKPIQRRKAK